MTTTPTATPALPPPSVKNEAHGIAVPLQLSVHASGPVSLQELLPPPLPFSSPEAQAAARRRGETRSGRGPSQEREEQGCCSRCGPDGVCVSRNVRRARRRLEKETVREERELCPPEQAPSPSKNSSLLLLSPSPHRRPRPRLVAEEKLDQVVAHRKKGKSCCSTEERSRGSEEAGEGDRERGEERELRHPEDMSGEPKVMYFLFISF